MGRHTFPFAPPVGRVTIWNIPLALSATRKVGAHHWEPREMLKLVFRVNQVDLTACIGVGGEHPSVPTSRHSASETHDVCHTNLHHVGGGGAGL